MSTIPFHTTVDEISKAIAKMIGTSSSSLIRYRYPKDGPKNIKDIKGTLTTNPKFIEDIIGIIGKDIPLNTKSDDILKIISDDETKRKAILDALRGLQLPDSPIWMGGSGSSKTGAPDSDPSDPSGPDVSGPISAIKDKTSQAAGTEGTTTDPMEVTKTSGKNENTPDGKTRIKVETDPNTKTRTKTKEEDDEEEDPKPPDDRDPRGPDKKEGDAAITEQPISNLKQRMNVQQQWMPEYTFGGQNILKLTDVEKLEELKQYTLFDLVNPLLIGDENNLLALQNKIQENRRFTNTYANPRPERPLPPPPANIEAWRQPMRSVYPVPFPFTLDTPHAQNYYDHWANQDYKYLNKNLDSIARGGTFDPDLQKVLNNKRDSYTSTDPKIMNHTTTVKPSLLEDFDSSSITALDLLLIR
jgi:hypothetical protein